MGPVGTWSGKRDSNSRPQPWQGCALPTELFPRKPTCYRKSGKHTSDFTFLTARKALWPNVPRLAVAGEKQGKRSEEHTSELQSQSNLVCRLLLEKKKKTKKHI